MNQSEKKELDYFPKALDEHVNNKFPDANCKTSFAFLSMQYYTEWADDLPAETNKEIELYIEAFLAGNQELSNRLKSLSK